MKNTQNLTTHGMILSSFFTTLIVIGTFIKIPIPFLPFTLQFLFTNLAALLLGSKYGTLSVISYVALGLIGLPVFSSGGGIQYVFYPTFGYLLGFILGTYVAAKILDSSHSKDTKKLLIASFINLSIVYIIGMIYYYFIANYYIHTPIGIGSLFLYCFVLAIPGDILLCFLSASIAKRLNKIIEKE